MSTILALFDATDMNPEKYARVMADLDAAGTAGPAGRIFHIAARKGEGMIVVDRWESGEMLQAFSETLVPILVKNGVTPPRPEVYPIQSLVAV